MEGFRVEANNIGNDQTQLNFNHSLIGTGPIKFGNKSRPIFGANYTGVNYEGIMEIGGGAGNNGVILTSNVANPKTFLKDGKLINVTNLTNTTSSGTVTITATRTSFPTLTAQFSISKVNAGADGDDAVLYRLVTIPNVVNKTSTGVFSPSTISISVRKIVGTTNTAVTTTGEGVQIRASRDNFAPFTTSNNGTLSISSSCLLYTSPSPRDS